MLRTIILLFIFPIITSAQEIVKTIKTSQYTNAQSVAFLDPYIFMDKEHSTHFDRGAQDVWILKIDQQLNVLDSTHLNGIFPIGTDYFLSCEKILVNHQNQILVILNAHKHTYDSTGAVVFSGKSYLLKFDKNLQLLDSAHLKIDSLGPKIISAVIHNNNLLLGGYSFVEKGFRPLFLELETSNFNITNLRLYNKRNNLYDGSIKSMVKKEDSWYFGIEDQSNTFSGTEILVLDTLFNVSDTIKTSYPGQYYPRFYSFNLTKDDFNNIHLIGYHLIQLDTSLRYRHYLEFSIAQLDTAGNISNVVKMPFSGHDFDPFNISFGNKIVSENMDFSNADSIFIVANGNFNIGGFGYIKDYSNPIYLYNYNLNTNSLNWSKVIDNGYNHSSLTLALNLPDNKYLVGLNQYNWDKYPGPNLAIILMVLNEHGDIISQKEFSTPNSGISTYPNPFEGVLYINGLDENGFYYYHLFNSAGGLVVSGNIDGNAISFNKSYRGTYILKIISETGMEAVLKVNGR